MKLLDNQYYDKEYIEEKTKRIKISKVDNLVAKTKFRLPQKQINKMIAKINKVVLDNTN